MARDALQFPASLAKKHAQNHPDRSICKDLVCFYLEISCISVKSHGSFGSHPLTYWGLGLAYSTTTKFENLYFVRVFLRDRISNKRETSFSELKVLKVFTKVL
jgi:hypothetical protein